MIYTRFLYGFVFITGASVTALEMIASRFFAPYFGASIFVWANVIGVVLIGLAVGYWQGGKLADKHPFPKVLFFITAASGFLTTFIPFFLDIFLKLVSPGETFGHFFLSIIISSFFATSFLFLAPIILLGMVSPFAARVMVKDIKAAGETIGSLYAFSTIGSVLGIFGSSFYLIPYIGSRTSILAIGIILIAIGIAGIFLFGDSKKNIYTVFCLLIAAALIAVLTGEKAFGSSSPFSSKVLEEKETWYQYFRVIEESDGTRKILTNANHIQQSSYHPDKILTGGYADYLALTPFLVNNNDLNIAIIGLSGGTVSREIFAFKPDSKIINIDGVEIDPEVVRSAKKYFALDEQPLNIHIEDGRTFLANTKDKYNAIFSDAYQEQLYIPFYLLTVEFFQTAKDHLLPGGIFVMNLNSASRETLLYKSAVATLFDVFPNVYSFRVPDSSNFLIIAAINELDLVSDRVPKPLETAYIQFLKDLKSESDYIKNASIFHDDRSSVELMTEKAVF